MMESLNKGDVLKVEALTMTKGVFDQLRQVKAYEVEGSFIGWVLKAGISEDFIGRAHGTLVKVLHRDVWESVYPKDEGAQETFKLAAEELGMGQAAYAGIKVDLLRDSLPQIFLK